MAALPATSSIAAQVTPSQAAPIAATSSAAGIDTTTAVVTSTAAVVTPSSSIPVVQSTNIIQSTILPTSTVISTTPLTSSTPSTSILPATSSIIPSSVVTTSTTPLSTSSTKPLTSSTTTLQTSTAIVTVTSQRGSTVAPGLVTASSKAVSSARGSASAAAGAALNGKGGIGGSGLSLGALIGIIAGGLIFLIVLALLVTRSLRKKARQRRTANRSSLFEPWPAPVAMEEEDGYEKGSYPMQEQEYDQSYPNYAGAGAGAGAAAAGYAQHQQPQAHEYVEYPVGQAAQQQQQYPPAQGQGYGDQGMVGPSGLRDGSMVRVKVAFVRSLEDELAIVPGQQLYLHTAYDDGWSLCEDQNQTRGVVPVSCLEPWDEPSSMTRSNTNGSLGVNSAGQRRSSLHNGVNGVEYGAGQAP